MKIVCSYCRKDMGEKEPLADTGITHSMCPDCFAYYIDQVRGISFDEYLDRYDLPILVLDADARIAACNRLARETLGKTESDITGLLAGEGMECEFARLPEGCGHTTHCMACSIRNTVKDTHESGRPVVSMKAYLNRADRRNTLVISARKVGDFVRIIVEAIY